MIVRVSRLGLYYKYMCFTPKVTLATFILEWGFAIWALIRYHGSRFGQLGVLLLALLGVYQFSEYAVCRGSDPLLWGRIGFATIAVLPAIGIHLTVLLWRYHATPHLIGRITRWVVPISYFAASAFAILFLLNPAAIQSASCMPRYIQYGGSFEISQWFGAYYDVLIIWTIIALTKLYQQSERLLKNVTAWLAIGYLSFIFPTYLVIFLFPFMNAGFPSVLCGFAIFLAIIMVWKILPRHAEMIEAARTTDKYG